MILQKSFTALLVSSIFILTGSAYNLLEHAFSKYRDFPKIPQTVDKALFWQGFAIVRAAFLI